MPELRAVDVGKSYGAVRALTGVNFTLEPGTVHALLGENGAGKSTLVKILTGSVAPDTGSLEIDRTAVRFAHTADAARHGVAVVSQELSLFGDLDVLSNLYSQRELTRWGMLDRKRMWERARPVLGELGLSISPTQSLGSLSLAEQQLIEIAKALLVEPSVLILDEPTSALDDESSQRLFDVLKVLRRRKVGVVFVSHILEDVMALSDHITVLRDGRVVLEGADRQQLSLQEIVTAMLGDKLDRELAAAQEVAPSRVAADAQALVIEGVALPGSLQPVDLTIRVGEIVGLAGAVGAGHEALIRAVAGLSSIRSGRVALPGRQLGPVARSRPAAVRSGIGFVSGDRRNALMGERPIWENIVQVQATALGRHGRWMRRESLRKRATTRATDVGVKCRDVDQRADALSGGNQQKVVFAMWQEAEPGVLILDDPTRGVDVGAKAEMHALIRKQSDSAAVLLCSTDLDEMVAICDRVEVFRRGKLVAELSGEGLNRHSLLTEMNASDESDQPGPASEGN